ncbi:MAG: cytochrome c biogenesis protein CcdA [Pseudomonadota bacterium]
MELIFGYLAGLLTLINPCILPVLPIALSSALSANRAGPLIMAFGLMTTFTILGLFAASIGPGIGLTEDVISQASAVIMVFFGLVLLVPNLNARFATATSGFAGSVDQKMFGLDQTGTGGLFLGGMLLGAVWSPCIGPTLGGAISLAAHGGSLVWSGAIMLSFSMGVATIILALGYGAKEVIRSRQQAMRSLAAKSRSVMGFVFLAVGLGIFFKLHHKIDAALINVLPYWLQDLSVAL